MKLLRFGEKNQERPGVELANGTRLDVSAFGEDYGEQFWATDGLARLKSWLEKHQQNCPLVAPEIRLGTPFKRPSKIICVGLNYADHAHESGMELPTEPVIFYKSTSALNGPFDPVILPKGSQKTDWEVELAFIIAKKAKYVKEVDAMQHLAAYVLHNDLTERAFQLEHGGQWLKGKGADTFAPMGPYAIGREAIEDPHQLSMSLSVNGVTMQASTTANLIFKIPFLIAYISRFMTLLPGDVVSTGTPAGVGMGFQPPKYLQAGDIIELEIEKLGSARQEVYLYQEE